MRWTVILASALVALAPGTPMAFDWIDRLTSPVAYWEGQVSAAEDNVRSASAGYQSAVAGFRAVQEGAKHQIRAYYLGYISEGYTVDEAQKMAREDMAEDLRIEREVVELMKWQLDEMTKHLFSAQVELDIARGDAPAQTGLYDDLISDIKPK